jgi:hypothetical protein
MTRSIRRRVIDCDRASALTDYRLLFKRFAEGFHVIESTTDCQGPQPKEYLGCQKGVPYSRVPAVRWNCGEIAQLIQSEFLPRFTS